MIPAIIYIGTSQSIFAAILMGIKKPSNVANKILISWFSVISAMFILNIFRFELGIINEGLWPISISLSITFPQFIYLYVKYITKECDKFRNTDFLHFLPFLFSLIIIAFVFRTNITTLKEFADYYDKQVITRTIIGDIYIVCLWGYTIAAFLKIYRYKKQIGQVYSFKSDKINLNWLLILVIFHFIVSHFIIIMSSYQIKISLLSNIELYRSGALLIYVYVLSIWGFIQQQLISSENTLELNKTFTFEEPNSDRYKKSGLKKEQARTYLQQLIAYMNISEAWKDNELSISKLSVQTKIPKHYITEVLNENLQKNFYTFVNEYRTENAKKLIISPKYNSWSFLAIAYECGFNSKTAFNNFFKKYTGMTPTEYKKANTL